MRLGSFCLASAGLLVLGLAACHPPHPHDFSHHDRQISALDCPPREGDLSLQGAATPRSCTYAGDEGDQVTLQLVDLKGTDSHAAIAAMEAQVNAELPDALRKSSTDAAAGSSGGEHDADEPGEHTNIDLPGIHIHSNSNGRADVNVGGVNVSANDHGSHHGDAHVTVDGGSHGGVVVDSNEGGAQVRIQANGKGVRMMYFLTSDNPGPHGYRVAGYQARGPAQGPIVVATMFSKRKDDDDLRHDVSALLRHNIGD